ncbi:hypothetical protein OHB12_29305 [Nocardia sp. NBC_01730]|uniref:hypothetical protein n=1 Tax=Nocardia sp. NBC_01730 TaxID=2975998 RepID=UPI002E15CBBD|nr:hypothetical protein OHB12_29305 [Nocardia sp. NBC_01730]
MTDLAVASDAICRYGDASAAMAVETAAAGAANQAATMAAAIPVFGLIGQDFLAAFAFAQANNLMSVTELAAVHAATAMTCYESAAAYDLTEDAAVTEFGTVGKRL